MRDCSFEFDEGPTFEGFTDGTYWNGSLNVWVEPAMRDAICDWWTAQYPLDDDVAEANAEMRAMPVGANGLVALAFGYAVHEVHESRDYSYLRDWYFVACMYDGAPEAPSALFEKCERYGRLAA